MLSADSENTGVLRAAASEDGRGHCRPKWQRKDNTVEESEECTCEMWSSGEDLRHESKSHAENSGDWCCHEKYHNHHHHFIVNKA